MAGNEHSSPMSARRASLLLRYPHKATIEEIQALAGSVLTQARDRKPRKYPVQSFLVEFMGGKARLIFQPEER
jgi:hypothetical protein